MTQTDFDRLERRDWWHENFCKTCTRAARAQAEARFWRRSALGTWVVNLLLTAVLVYLLWVTP